MNRTKYYFDLCLSVEKCILHVISMKILRVTLLHKMILGNGSGGHMPDPPPDSFMHTTGVYNYTVYVKYRSNVYHIFDQSKCPLVYSVF